MKTDRSLLDEKLRTKFKMYLTGYSDGKKQIKTLSKECFNKFNVPDSLSNDLFTLRTDIREYDDKIAFFYSKLFKLKVETYFTEVEINEYSNSKYQIETVKLPIEFDCVQIAEDQWIGMIDIQYLMQLRDAQMINYNEKTQRTLSKRTVNGIETFTIAVNWKQVQAIKDSMKNGQYVPDAITLNIPIDTTNYYYDSEERKLIIEDIKYFDILDGYHRYLAMSAIYNEDNNFTYPMELRISAFPEDKASYFIFQQDQKTKMKKSDSNALNIYDPANKIINKLNYDRKFILAGLITRNEGIINQSRLSFLINNIYLKGVVFNKKNTLSNINRLSNSLLNELNIIITEQQYLQEKSWTDDEISAAIIMCKFSDNLADEVSVFSQLVKKMQDPMIHKMLRSSSHISANTYKKLEKIYNDTIKKGGE